jgi:transposase
MIQITAQMRVLVAIESVDGRKGIDSLVRLCQEKLSEDPFSGCVFVFEAAAGPRSGCSVMMAKATGLHRSGCRRGSSPGGPKLLKQLNRWSPTKLSC